MTGWVDRDEREAVEGAAAWLWAEASSLLSCNWRRRGAARLLSSRLPFSSSDALGRLVEELLLDKKAGSGSEPKVRSKRR
jgi:hypothetical protein